MECACTNTSWPERKGTSPHNNTRTYVVNKHNPHLARTGRTACQGGILLSSSRWQRSRRHQQTQTLQSARNRQWQPGCTPQSRRRRGQLSQMQPPPQQQVSDGPPKHDHHAEGADSTATLRGKQSRQAFALKPCSFAPCTDAERSWPRRGECPRASQCEQRCCTTFLLGSTYAVPACMTMQ